MFIFYVRCSEITEDPMLYNIGSSESVAVTSVNIDCIYDHFIFFNHFPNKPWFLRVCRNSLLKTMWEKEKLLVTSNFSFSHSVFYPFIELFAIFIKLEIVVCKVFQFGRVQSLSFGKGLRERLLSPKRTVSIVKIFRLLLQ